MRVQTTTLQSRTPAPPPSGSFPASCRWERCIAITPEYARFLYALIGGPWTWVDRLGWTREQWEAELAVPGTEFWILYADGAPQGYVQLQPQPESVSGRDSEDSGEGDPENGCAVEIRYFGLAASAIGRGWGRLLLEHGLSAAWSLADRHPTGPVERVWVHTCTLDGPAALANYRARGLEVCEVSTSEEDVPAEPLGSWVSTGGPAS